MIKTIDLFSGAGLMTEGFRQAGFNSIFAAEADERAVASFNRNLDPVAKVWNDCDVVDDLRADVIVAGPPCQGFSTLGKRDSNDARNKLSLTILRWVQAAQPKVVVIENVPQFVESKYWKAIERKAKLAGYTSCVWKLNSVDFGAPQVRTRVFCILSKIGMPEEPQPTHRKPKTVREAFRGLPNIPNGKMQHEGPTPVGIAAERIRLIPENGDKRDVLRQAPHLCPPSWFKMGLQAVDVWGRMRLDTPANTIRCCFQNASKGRYLHPTENRVITLREGARLQGVPDSWTFVGDRSSVSRQIGNGVPIPLAKAVADSIFKLISKKKRIKKQLHEP
jgi:DNA (cytosine-5)-methyltransferase 1